MPSFDLSAVLSEVHPNGGVYNISQGYRRVNLGEVTEPVQIILQPICIQIAQGSAIRLSLSAACFPAYPVNAGTGATPGESKAITAQIITLTLQTEGSRILLPIAT